MPSYEDVIFASRLKDSQDDAANEHLLNLINSIPQGTEYHANRYNTDDTLVLHIWDDNGNSYDLIAKKELMCHIQGDKQWTTIIEPNPPKKEKPEELEG